MIQGRPPARPLKRALQGANPARAASFHAAVRDENGKRGDNPRGNPGN